MTEVMKMTKKAVSTAVVASTIAWSVSLSAFLAPLTAKAAVTPGTLVKASLPAVYYVGQDGKRYVFPNEKTYKTWYADFSGVVTITDAELASLMIGGNVTYKPGVRMVKITTDPKVYAVDHNGNLRPIASEAVAAALYGANWNQQIDDVPDAFFTNYTVGAAVNSASDFNPASASAAATSINQDKGLGSGAVTGSVSVMLSSGQPTGGTVPQGATGVNVLKFDVRNSSSSAVTLNSLTVHRSGPGQADDFSNVYVYAGAARLTTGRTINTSTNDATFSGLNLSLAAGETKTLWIGVDLATGGAAEAGNVNSFSVTSVMVGGASAVGTPVSGPSFTTAGVSVGTITVDDTGTISSVKAGGTQQKVGSFRLTAPSNEDVDFSSISLFYGGTANRSDVTNITLKQAGLTLATVASISDKDLAVLALSSPMYMERGASRTFEVYADIAAGVRASDNVEFYLDQDADLHATGRTYGYGLGVINNYASGSQIVSVEAGKFTVTFNGPAAHDIAVNGKDVELFNFTVAAQANLEVRKTALRVVTTGSDVADIIRDLKIVDTANGSIVAGPKDGSDAAMSQDFEFTETWNLNAGQSRTFKVTADIANDTNLNGDTVRVTLGDVVNGVLFPTNAIRNLDNSTYLSNVSGDFVPSTQITGNVQTINAAGLTASVSSTPVSQTYIQGTQNAAMFGLSLKAGDAGAVKVHSVKFTSYVDSDTAGTFTLNSDGTTKTSDLVLTAKLWNGSTQVGDIESPATANGTLVFDNLNLTIPAGQTINLVLSANLAGSVNSIIADADRIKFAIDAAGDIDATDEDGDSINVTNNATNGDDANSGIRMTISDTGAIAVVKAADDTESEAGIVVGSANNVVLGKFRFSATNEELRLAKLRVNVATPNTVSSISLYDGATLVGGPVSVDGSGNADFSGMTGFVIPKDGNKTLTVKGNMNSVGASGSTAGTSALVTLMNTAGTFEVRGTSAGSSTVLTSMGGNLAGNAKVVYKSKPTVSLAALGNTLLQNSTMAVFRFTVSADAAGDVAFGELEFTVNASGGVNFACDTQSSLRKVGDGSNLAGSCGTGANSVSVTLGAEQVVSAGSSKTYDLRLVISDVTGGDDSFSTSLDSTGFLWSDYSATNHDTTTYGSADWFPNGTYIKVLPTDSVSLQD